MRFQRASLFAVVERYVMDKLNRPSKDAAKLRRRAEERLQETKAEGRPLTTLEAQRLFHELEVHQIELEMQNAELHQAHEEMSEVLERYTDLYDFAPVGYYTLDIEGEIRAANLAGAALLGLDRSHLLGRNFDSFIVRNARPAFTAFLRAVAAHRGKESSEIELQLASVQDGNAPLFMQIQAVVSSTGREFRIAAIDITKRRKAEQKLHTTIHDLRTFSYSVSHDLRTPLRTINSYATIVLGDFGESLSDEVKKLVTAVVNRSVSMGNLIDDLLKFSRNSMQELTFCSIDMTALAGEIIGRLASEEQNRNIEFRVAELPKAMGDRAMIAQVLENLISNAVKFSRNVGKPVITVGSVADGKDNTYFVKDNGVGFDVKYVGTIFNVFQRLHPSEEFEGTGVGLAIVEQVITKHGGRVWADSKQGKGATFYFSLPKS
jgi:PAS domain S-box-containing protein